MKYLLSDTAVNGDYTQYLLKKNFPQHQSLFIGTKDEKIEQMAPYLFAINEHPVKILQGQPGTTLKAFLLIESTMSLDELAAHFRKHIYVTKEGKKYYFRCWDGRVLEKCLPDFTKEQFLDLFNSITEIIYEDHVNSSSTIFKTEGKKLRISQISITSQPAGKETSHAT